ncbi:MAG TPA: YIP1 family protein [Longimicrobiales bacterium]|nr:YIP1 family protein [Longimicrobiales bacterium]
MRRSFADRLKGAALLDIAVYEEVEADRDATGQAALVVGLVAVATAIGGIRDGATGILGGLISAYAGWLVWSGVTYLVGSWLGGTATWGELLRTVGFAHAPGLLRIFGVIPILGVVVRVAVGIWMLIAVIVAIRQALDFSTEKAILTAVIGFALLMAVQVLLWLLLFPVRVFF